MDNILLVIASEELATENRSPGAVGRPSYHIFLRGIGRVHALCSWSVALFLSVFYLSWLPINAVFWVTLKSMSYREDLAHSDGWSLYYLFPSCLEWYVNCDVERGCGCGGFIKCVHCVGAMVYVIIDGRNRPESASPWLVQCCSVCVVYGNRTSSIGATVAHTTCLRSSFVFDEVCPIQWERVAAAWSSDEFTEHLLCVVLVELLKLSVII